MKHVKTIIDTLGGLESLLDHPISLRVPSFMPLSIEAIGRGPRGGLLISVMHFFEQNGDLMRDPDVEIEIEPKTGEWLPVSYRQDSLGLLQEAVSVEDGSLQVDEELVRDLQSFLGDWDRNIGDQGFLEAAKALAAERPRGPG